jgi:hypothetical protein
MNMLMTFSNFKIKENELNTQSDGHLIKETYFVGSIYLETILLSIKEQKNKKNGLCLTKYSSGFEVWPNICPFCLQLCVCVQGMTHVETHNGDSVHIIYFDAVGRFCETKEWPHSPFIISE